MSHNVTMVTGPTGSGKSTLIQLVHRHLADDQRKMAVLDTSGCIEKSRRCKTKAGKELMKLRGAQESGFLLPGDLVVESVMENLKWLGEYGPPPFHVFLAGSPRTLEEAQAWLDLSRAGEVTFRVILIECTRDEVYAGISVRQKSGVRRRDDSNEGLKTKWDEYQGQTLPLLSLLDHSILSRTKRERPLLERVHNLVSTAAVAEHVKRKWFLRLHDNKHPIHRDIQRVEDGLGLEERPAPVNEFSRRFPNSYFFQPGGCKPLFTHQPVA